MLLPLRADHRIFLTARIYSFRPETLTCRPGQNASNCLTADQIDALHRIYADYYEANQTYVFGGYYPGGEKRYYSGLVGQTQFKIGRAYFQFMVTKCVPMSVLRVNAASSRTLRSYSDTDWKIHQYDADLLAFVDELDPGNANVSLTSRRVCFPSEVESGL